LVVEVDGGVHSVRGDYDQAREEWLIQRGFRVLRFTNEAVMSDLEGVLARIAQACEVVE
jgi:very-short-patch-repair endonuclease